MTYRITSALCLITLSCAAPLARPAPFRVRADSVEQGDLRGPFDGRVVDADSARPVPGALVYAIWSLQTGNGLVAPAGFEERVLGTNEDGRYQILGLDRIPRGTRIVDFTMVIYKKGYVAYRSDRRFDDLGPRFDFAQRSLEIKLERWRSDVSHVRHLQFVGGGPTLAALPGWELTEAATELSGATPVSQPSVAPSAAPLVNARPEQGQEQLRAANFLTAEDISHVTGCAGSFKIRKLGDEPASPSYDNIHLRAKGQPETFDVALRVWVLDVAEAQKQFGNLKEELPGAQERSDIGDRSLRAISENQDIFGVAFLEGKRGVVALLTCGAAQCRSSEVALTLARRVKERIDIQLGGTP